MSAVENVESEKRNETINKNKDDDNNSNASARSALLKRRENMDPMLETNPKRQALRGSDSEILIKFCVPSSVVGSLIGKGGENVNELMKQSETRIHMSRPHELFHGTRDRICTIYGGEDGMNSVLVGLHLVLAKVLAEDSYNAFQFKLIMPAQACGSIIGRGGSNIKAIIDETGSNLKVSDQSQMPPGMPYRLLTMSGTIEQMIQTVALCLQKALLETDYLRNIKNFHGLLDVNHHGHGMDGFGGMGGMDAGGFGIGGRQNQYGSRQQGPYQQESSSYFAPGEGALLPPGVTATISTVCEMKMPDEFVGCIIGKGGNVINGVKNQTGCDVKVSERGYDEPGVPGLLETSTANAQIRTVTITGTEQMVIRAYNIFLEQLRNYCDSNRFDQGHRLT